MTDKVAEHDKVIPWIGGRLFDDSAGGIDF